MPADLFMVEVRASDWARSLVWYREALGLPLLMEDRPGRFALLEAGGCRVALKGGASAESDRGCVRLVFQVSDVDCERLRLVATGIDVGEAMANTAEGYREVRLLDPDGTPITLFSWTPDRI